MKNLIDSEVNSEIADDYLILSINKEDNIIDYQVKMLYNNRVDHIIPFKINRINNTINLNYDIANKISIEEYTKSFNLEYSLYLRILESIAETVKLTQQYMLLKDNFILNPKKIYIDKETMDVNYIYLPLKNSDMNNEINPISELIEWLTTKVELNDEKVVKLSCEIFKLSKTDKFNIADIKNYINTINQQFMANINTDNNFVDEKQKSKSDKKLDSYKKTNSRIQIKSMFSKNKFMKYIIVVQVVIFILIVSMLFVFRDYSSENKIGIILLLGVVDIIISRKIKDVCLEK